MNIPENAVRALASVISEWTGGHPDTERMAREGLETATPLIVAAELDRMADDLTAWHPATGVLRRRATELGGGA